MGYIEEPVGINLNISPMPLTTEDRQLLSNIIAQYKATGEIPVFSQKSIAKKPLQKGFNQQKVKKKNALTA
jgi:hypothetical protein